MIVAVGLNGLLFIQTTDPTDLSKCEQIIYDKAGFNAINIMHMSEAN